MTKKRVPDRFDIPTRFFGSFTVQDLARILLPVGVVFFLLYPEISPGQLPVLAAAGVFGTALYMFQPYGRTVDSHLIHAVRWLFVGGRQSSFEELIGDVHVTDRGDAVGVVQVSSTNLEMKTEAEQEALHSICQELLSTVNYPVEIHSRQKPLEFDRYVQHLVSEDVGDTDLGEAYLKYCHRLSETELATTDHYVVVRSQDHSQHWLAQTLPDRFVETSEAGVSESAIQQVDSRCTDVLDVLNTGDLTASRLNRGELEAFARRFNTARYETTEKYTASPDEDGNGTYRRTVAIEEFPTTVEIGWPAEIQQVDGFVDTVQVIRPKNNASVSKKLQRLSGKLNAEIDSFLRHGHRGTNKLEAVLEDVNWMLDLLADREDQPVEYAAYISVHDDNEEKCNQALNRICNRLDTLQIDYKTSIFRTDQAQSAVSPANSDRFDESQLMPASSAAAGFPFTTQVSDQDTGVVYGTDATGQMPVLLDRFEWSSHSMARMGMVGSGKSYAAKIELIRSILAYPDLQVIVVDPKKEYRHLVRTLGGTVRKLEHGTDYNFNKQVLSFEVAGRGQQENVDLLADVVQQVYDAVSQDRSRTLVVVDEARILMNDQKGRRVLNDFVLEGRDTNTAITLISQNASHFTHCREGREILDNMPGKVFMRHDRVPEDVVNYFDLSQEEKQQLFQLKTGTSSDYSEAIVKVSGRLDTKIKVESTTAEHALTDTEVSL